MSSRPNEFSEAAGADEHPAQQTWVIRRATFTDLPAISKIWKAAFWDEDAVGRFMHPNREQYPMDVERWWKRRLRDMFIHWQHDVIVAVDSKSGEILGAANWSRNGPGAEKIKGKGWRWTFRHILPVTVKFINKVSEKVHPNRAASDPSRLTAFDRAIPFVAHFWEPPRDDCWDLAVLGVNPAHHGKGVGRLLVAWGMKHVVDENIAASVVSADKKDRFYMLCGFEVVVGNVTEGEGNPLAGIKGGSLIFRDRKATENDESA